ncbi:hypothetical protein C8J56DRAFT_1062527 [Mycena floridula]|nr:hypothetical protein C8J56DRAFT_1062527 [Mycena floridula]
MKSTEGVDDKHFSAKTGPILGWFKAFLTISFLPSTLMMHTSNEPPLFHDDLCSGCTPPLCLSTALTNLTSGNYPFYVLLEGPHQGIYSSWDIVKSYKDNKMVARGCRDQADALSKWRVNCLLTHKHIAGDNDSFVDPFQHILSQKAGVSWSQGPHWVNSGDLAASGHSQSRSQQSSPSKVKGKYRVQVPPPLVHYLVDVAGSRSVYSDRATAQQKYMAACAVGEESSISSTTSLDGVMEWLESLLISL